MSLAYYKRRLSFGIPKIAGILLLISFLSVLFSPKVNQSYWMEQMKSVINLGLTFVMIWGSWEVFRRFDRSFWSRLAFGMIAIMLVLLVLEAYTPFKLLSDKFREVFYAGRFIYSSELRDIQFHGGKVRPCLFSQEPSHVAKFFSALVVVWFCTNQARHRYLGAIIFFALGFYLIASPSLLIIPIIIGGVMILKKEQSTAVSFIKVVFIVLGLIVCVIGSPLLLKYPRFAAIINDEDASAIIRLKAPYHIAYEVINDYPYFGVGIGGKENAKDILLSVYSQYQVIKMERFYKVQGAGWGNSFSEIPIFYGIIGGVCFFAVLFVLSGYLLPGYRHIAFMVFCVVFNLDAGIVSFAPWSYSVFIIVGVMKGLEHSGRTKSQNMFNRELEKHEYR